VGGTQLCQLQAVMGGHWVGRRRGKKGENTKPTPKGGAASCLSSCVFLGLRKCGGPECRGGKDPARRKPG
jgi:hypothetical protein